MQHEPLPSQPDHRHVPSGPILDVGTVTDQIDDERIARAAYAIYEARGRADGHAEDDWCEAAAAYALRAIRPAAANAYGASASLGVRVRASRR